MMQPSVLEVPAVPDEPPLLPAEPPVAPVPAEPPVSSGGGSSDPEQPAMPKCARSTKAPAILKRLTIDFLAFALSRKIHRRLTDTRQLHAGGFKCSCRKLRSRIVIVQVEAALGPGVMAPQLPRIQRSSTVVES
jgi:hypothetical protein